jgi:hypothetical protein
MVYALGVRRANDVLLALSATLVVVLSALRANVFWRSEAYLDDASGNWTALARDFAAGVLYRPLQGPDGYGGSRYFPLHFILHAAFMKVLGSPIAAGHVVATLAIVLLMAAVYAWLRVSGAPWLLAVSCASFVLAIRPAQEALLAIKGDGLAAALNVWGVAVCAGAAGTTGILGAALLFTLAFATKITAVSGVTAAVLWLWLTGQRRAAAGLIIATAAGMVLVLVAIQLGSHGVAFGVLRASASGGATLSDILKSPLSLAQQARRVPETLAFIQLGCAAFLALFFWPKPWTSLPLLFFVCVFAVTTVIFGSPGTDTNHFLDLHVASVVLVASWLVVRGLPPLDFATTALIVAALAASMSLGSGLINARSEQQRGLLSDALRLIPDHSRPILAQNPMVPIAAGQRPYLIDPFMIRLLSERDPALAEPLWRDIEERRFAAVVLEADPRTERARALYRSAILGERFLQEMDRNYEVAGAVGTRTVYLPRRPASQNLGNPGNPGNLENRGNLENSPNLRTPREPRKP